MAGNVDIVGGLSGVDAQVLAEDPRVNAFFVYQAMTTWLIWNFTHPHLSDVRVRQALAHGTDRSELHRVLGFPDGVPVTDGVFFMCDPQNIRASLPYPYDPLRAEAVLAEAGWLDSDGDGVLDRDGESFTFTLLLDSRATTAAVFVQDQLRRIGIDMRLEPLEWSVIATRFEAGDFDAIIAFTSTPERKVVAMDSPLGLLDRELALTVTAAETEPDLERRLQLWDIAGQLYRDLAPALFLHPRLRVLVADRRIMGFGEPGTIVRRMAWRHAFGGLEHLWIADEESVRR
jgi:peptide/nickel transport system substrate-binding protein